MAGWFWQSATARILALPAQSKARKHRDSRCGADAHVSCSCLSTSGRVLKLNTLFFYFFNKSNFDPNQSKKISISVCFCCSINPFLFIRGLSCPLIFRHHELKTVLSYIYLDFLTTSFLFLVVTLTLKQNPTLLDGSNVRLNWNIESDMNVNWIKFKNFLSLYWFKNKQHWIEPYFTSCIV